MIILRDTREKQPWGFDWYDEVKEVRRCTVKVGDYTMLGYESVVAIERKRSTGELSINFGKKRKQFFAELEKMKDIPHRYIVCEFPKDRLDEFPKNSGIPMRDWKYLRMNGGFIRKTINDITEKYNVNFIFCDSAFMAQDEVYRIFQEIVNGKIQD